MKLALRSATSRRAVGVAAALIAGAISLNVAMAPTAQASTQDWVTMFQNQETWSCLDAYGGLHAAHYSYCTNNTNDQKWNIHPWADKTNELKSVLKGTCIDDSDAYGLRLFPCNATPFQSWYIKTWNDGTIELKNQATGRCLDDSEAYGLRTFPCNATKFQSWWY
ncbi:ricin-type beta-trefoil lectin domain protein [Streptomyces sp. NPDC001292]|uniref:RICIN domain-containing protein n=1 Tax=Streptomyces sp. NPDC001292 TaxID=3364558 RepID=UPI0036ACA55C